MHAGRSFAEVGCLQSDDWSWFCDFWFDTAVTEIRLVDQAKFSTLVATLRRETTRRVAIDGAVRDRGVDTDNPWVANLQRSLMGAGIDAGRIVVGELGRAGMYHARRVEVLIGPP
ncbi:hypothetical protein [uncultured Piscinibacter sp.]|mgnify:CR=1 FL=1|uniref:hypothetical protein n=1 Tax=uncultured Piscinibacter sp. TaxID=1131835 RepID=UPI00260493A9|nr:hypothetical protein [uncultured Piscinibacter sp.]